MHQLGHVCLFALIVIAPGAGATVSGGVPPHAYAAPAGLPGSFLHSFSHLAGDDMSLLWQRQSPDQPFANVKSFLPFSKDIIPEPKLMPIEAGDDPRDSTVVQSIGAVAAGWPARRPLGDALAASAAVEHAALLLPSTDASSIADFPSWEAIRVLRSLPAWQDRVPVSGQAGQGPAHIPQLRASLQAWRLPTMPEPNAVTLALCAVAVIAFIVRKKLQLPA